MTGAVDLSGIPAAASRMFAVVVSNGRTEFQRRRRLVPMRGYVAVKVRTIGLCRTDMAVIDGTLKVTQPLIPGHEFSGIVSEVGESVQGLVAGQAVAVNPLLSCNSCPACDSGKLHKCPNVRMMGVDEDGACCEEVLVSADRVFALPRGLSFFAAAFAEPVSAVLSVADVPFLPDSAGAIIGDNRIGILTQRVLTAVSGVSPHVLSLDCADDLPSSSLDFVIESQLTTDVLQTAVRLLRPGGTLVIKSRRQNPLPFDILAALRKEIIIRFAHYGCFRLAVQLLSERRVLVDDLIGKSFPLKDFSEAVAWARQTETRKTFLTVENL